MIIKNVIKENQSTFDSLFDFSTRDCTLGNLGGCCEDLVADRTVERADIQIAGVDKQLLPVIAGY